jgi:hypothetical protein
MKSTPVGHAVGRMVAALRGSNDMTAAVGAQDEEEDVMTDETAPRSGVHEVVREFIATREEFTGPELAAALRVAGHVALAARVLDDPDLVTALLNEHAGPGGDDEQDEGGQA